MARFPEAPQYHTDRLLPEPLPADPMPILRGWIEEALAGKVQPNPNAMTLATIDPDGRPSARVVLCKALDPDAGTATFFTNRDSRKGAALAAHDAAALVFHWDTLNLQARVEGRVTHTTDAESDAYWKTRFVLSRVSVWASQQSRPVPSRAALLRKVEEAAARFGVPMDGSNDADVPRPLHWGGYIVWADRVELWIGQPGRVHDRALWTREIRPREGGYVGGPWSAARLQP